MRGLTGKIAVVTGGAQGIGFGVASRFVEEGATVVIADRDAERADAVVRQLAERGGTASSVAVDIADRAQVEQMAAQAVERHGHIDVLVNCAGVHQTKPWLELDATDWERIHQVNVLGLFFCCQAVAPHLMAQRSGRIVNIASIAGRRGSPLAMPYAASKASVMSLTRSLALALAPHDVTVNAVCPGYVVTPLTERAEEDAVRLGQGEPGERRRNAVAEIPLGRTSSPDDVAGLVVYLSSDDAAYLTGQCVDVSGGWIMP